MAAMHHLRVFVSYGFAILTLICFALIAGTSGQPLTGLVGTGLSTLGAYHAVNQLGSLAQGEYQGLTNDLGYPYQSQMDYSSSGVQGHCCGSSGY